MPSIRERLRRDDRATEQVATSSNGHANGNGHQELDLSDLRPSRTIADRMRPFGRLAFWAVLAIIFARGLSQIISPDEPIAPTVLAEKSWPDAQSEAFALDFARTYLSFSGDGAADRLTEDYNATVERYFTPDLRSDIATPAELPGHGVQQLYYSGEVTATQTVDSDHALITIEALISQDVPAGKRRAAFSGQKRVFLIVPVGRDGGGHLAIYAHPSVVAEPPTGAPDTLDTVSVADPGADEIEDLVKRFLGDYLSGAEAGALNFYLTPDAEVPPFEGGYRLIDVSDVQQLDDDEQTDTQRALLVTANVRDQTTDATYEWQYLIDVRQLDRWYVTGVRGGSGTALGPAAATPAADSESGTTTNEPAGSQ